MIIKTKTARSIKKYSVCNEEELMLLPNTQLKIIKIKYEKIDLSEEDTTNIVTVKVIELEEI